MAEILAEYRPARDHTQTRRFTYAQMALGALLLITGTLFTIGEGTWLGAAWMVLAALLFGAHLFSLRTRLRVRSDGIDWRRGVREKTLPWSEVASVEVRGSTNPYEPAVELTLTMAEGRRLQVPSDLLLGLAEAGSHRQRAAIVQGLKRGAEAQHVQFLADDALLD